MENENAIELSKSFNLMFDIKKIFKPLILQNLEKKQLFYQKDSYQKQILYFH